MLMMCWFYCIPFAKGLFFAVAPLLVLFAMFMLKRGVRQRRPQLRQSAFLLMFVAALKFFMFDLYMLRDKILCSGGAAYCNATGFRLLQLFCMLALLGTCALLLYRYRDFVQERRRSEMTPDDVRLPFWSRASLACVILLAIWLVAPWIGYLIIGHVPAFVMHVPWQSLAIINAALILIGFWKLEDCSWVYNPSDKNRKQHLARVWTPKDTLGLSTILFLIVLIFSYVSNDVLTTPSTRSHNVDIDKLQNLTPMGKGFQMPAIP